MTYRICKILHSLFFIFLLLGLTFIFTTDCIIATSSKRSEYVNKINLYFNQKERVTEISDFSYAEVFKHQETKEK